jgi:hypothetical protein
LLTTQLAGRFVPGINGGGYNPWRATITDTLK